MKSSRQESILKLVSEQSVQTQEELINKLRMLGYCVTQATVSRDIRELKLTKILTSDGSYRYVIPMSSGAEAITKINETLLGAITNIDYANNLIVVTTYPGMAQAVAAGIDAAKTPGILGCVGGDDTIIIVTRSEETARNFCGSYREQKLRA
jgi:transcriptional regulator of arginine metabolism